MKNIDTTIDYDALLEEAKEQYRAYNGELEKRRCFWNPDPDNYGFPESIQKEVEAFHKKCVEWEKENITSKGLILKMNLVGAPIAILAVLAGDTSKYYNIDK